MEKPNLHINIALIVAIVACLGVAVGISALIFGSLKSHPAYRMGMELAKNDPAVIELFGSPVKGGFFVLGTIRGYRYGGDLANLETSLSGPKARGTLSIYGNEDDNGIWQIDDMTIRIGGKMVLTYRGSEPGKGFQPMR